MLADTADSSDDARPCASASSTTACSPTPSGGAERWYRNLAERLAAEGHEVTYLTLRQWDRGEQLDLDERVRVVAAGPRMALYTGERAPADPAAARVRAGRVLAPAAPRPPLRRRAHLRVPVLLAARRGRRAPAARATGSSSTGSRCGAAPTGATTSAALGGRIGGARAAPLRARAPARLLLLGAARRSACARRGCAARCTVLRGLYAEPTGPGRSRARPIRSSCSPGG